MSSGAAAGLPGMGNVIASITSSLDGFVTGPDDGPGQGLGVGGERLHYWVFGGPWSYEDQRDGPMASEDQAFLDELTARTGAVLVGRTMYESAGAWGGTNPWPAPCVVLTHRTGDQPAPDRGFTFVSGFDEALATARGLAGDRDVALGGGADTIRQGLAAGVVDELHVSVAPVVLGAGKPLFRGTPAGGSLTPVAVRQSPWATHVTYRVDR